MIHGPILGPFRILTAGRLHHINLGIIPLAILLAGNLIHHVNLYRHLPPTHLPLITPTRHITLLAQLLRHNMPRPVQAETLRASHEPKVHGTAALPSALLGRHIPRLGTLAGPVEVVEVYAEEVLPRLARHLLLVRSVRQEDAAGESRVVLALVDVEGVVESRVVGTYLAGVERRRGWASCMTD